MFHRWPAISWSIMATGFSTSTLLSACNTTRIHSGYVQFSDVKDFLFLVVNTTKNRNSPVWQEYFEYDTTVRKLARTPGQSLEWAYRQDAPPNTPFCGFDGSDVRCSNGRPWLNYHYSAWSHLLNWAFICSAIDHRRHHLRPDCCRIDPRLDGLLRCQTYKVQRRTWRWTICIRFSNRK